MFKPGKQQENGGGLLAESRYSVTHRDRAASDHTGPTPAKTTGNADSHPVPLTTSCALNIDSKIRLMREQSHHNSQGTYLDNSFLSLAHLLRRLYLCVFYDICNQC